MPAVPPIFHKVREEREGNGTPTAHRVSRLRSSTQPNSFSCHRLRCAVSSFFHPTGYPKYLAASWMTTQNATSTGLLAAFIGPSSVAVTLEDPTYGNNTVSIDCDTGYPLVPNDVVEYTMTAEHPFGFSIRIPGWVTGATLRDSTGRANVSVANGTIYTYQYTTPGQKVVVYLSLPPLLRTVRRFNNAISIYYGPLLMALDFSYNVTVLQHFAFNSTDLQYLPIDAWNYAILIDDANPAAHLNITTSPTPPTTYPWGPTAAHCANGRLGTAD